MWEEVSSPQWETKSHFASLVAMFFEDIERLERWRKQPNRPSLDGPIVSPMSLLYCFSVFVLGVENPRAWNKANDQVGKKGHGFPWTCSGYSKGCCNFHAMGIVLDTCNRKWIKQRTMPLRNLRFRGGGGYKSSWLWWK